MPTAPLSQNPSLCPAAAVEITPAGALVARGQQFVFSKPRLRNLWLHPCLPSQYERSLSFKTLHLSREGRAAGAGG